MKRNDVALIQTAIHTNELIYWLRRIPFIKRYISINAYSNRNYKHWLRIASIAWAILKYAFINFILALLIKTFGGFIFRGGWFPFKNDAQAIVFATLLVSFLLAHKKILFEDHAFKWMYLNLFKGDGRDVYRFSLRKALINRSFLGLILGFIVFEAKGGWLALAFLMPVMVFLAHEALVLSYFKTHGTKIRFKHNALKNLGLFAFMLALTWLSIYSLFLFVAIIILGSIRFIQEYKRADSVFFYNANRYMKQQLVLSSDVTRELQELQRQASRIDEDVDIQKQAHFVHNLRGFRMLNRLFYARHQRIWRSPVLNSLKFTAIIGIIVLSGIGFGMVFFNKQTVELGESIFNHPLLLTRFFLMAMTFSNVTNDITKAFFMNCDAALLSYAFYRSKPIIWKQYLSRVTNLMLLNAIPAVAIYLWCWVFVAIGFAPFTWELVYLFANVLLLSCFITVLNLALYYLLQPFNQEMEIKSPLYNLIQGIGFFIIFQIPNEVFEYLGRANHVLVLGLIGFIGASCLLVYMVGDKTFKLRRG